MFANLVNLRSNQSGTQSTVATAIINGPENGGTLRRSIDGTVLSIKHQSSNENGKTPSLRSAVTIERPFTDDDGLVTKGYVRLITLTPVGKITVAQLAKLVNELVTFLKEGENPTAEDPFASDSEFSAVLARLMAGEP